MKKFKFAIFKWGITIVFRGYGFLLDYGSVPIFSDRMCYTKSYRFGALRLKLFPQRV